MFRRNYSSAGNLRNIHEQTAARPRRLDCLGRDAPQNLFRGATKSTELVEACQPGLTQMGKDFRFGTRLAQFS